MYPIRRFMPIKYEIQNLVETQNFASFSGRNGNYKQKKSVPKYEIKNAAFSFENSLVNGKLFFQAELGSDGCFQIIALQNFNVLHNRF